MQLPAFISKLNDRKSIIFFVCFVLATFFWLLSNLSYIYEEEVEIPVEYINVPEGKILRSTPPSSIILKVSASGWKLISLFWRESRHELTIDLSTLSNLNRISTLDYFESNNKQFISAYNIIGISPAGIDLEFEEKRSKKVPVKLIYNIEFTGFYDIAGKIKIQPDSVIVSGPQSGIDSIDNWETKPLDIVNPVRNIEMSVELEAGINEVDVDHATVSIVIPISEFTEKIIDHVPITLKNCEFIGDVLIFPNYVSIGFLVALDQFNEIEASDFDVVIDCSGIDLKKDKYLQVSVSTHANYIKNIRVDPEYVEYILYK